MTTPNLANDRRLLTETIFSLPHGWLARITALLPYAVLLLTFIFFGLTGHDPWKADEAYVFGIIHSMLDHDSWLVPLVAGEPFMEKPPLYAWVAALLVRCFGGVLSEPDAARMASGVFMVATCCALAKAARNWWGDGMGRHAPLIFIACLGLTVQAHMMMPDVPLLTGFALACWGFSVVLATPQLGGLLIGLGVGIGFLSKGLLAPGILGMTALALPLLFAQWRTRTYGEGLVIAFLASLPMLTIWPLLLYLRSPDLFMQWGWDNNFGRYFGTSAVSHGTEHAPHFWLQTLPWFTFPALPLAVCAVWRARGGILRHAGLQCLLVLLAITFGVLWSSASARAVYALPLLVPLALLATPAIDALQGISSRLAGWGSALLFGALAAMIWLVWIVMMESGRPPNWAWLLRLLPADFTPAFEPAAFVLAAAVTVGAIVANWGNRWTPVRGRALFGWTSGLTLVWALLSTLSMPWLDYGKSYSGVFGSIPWPAMDICIASVNLGESERAMLDYVSDRVTERQEIGARRDCDLLFFQGYAPVGADAVDRRQWDLMWTGARPGDTWQKFWLFRARPPAVALK
jgi:4-amino-4-deoxy-L-arabinose transferase-like glycosyltransferase